MERKSEKTFKDFLDGAFNFHNEELSRLRTQIDILTRENQSLKNELVEKSVFENKLTQSVKTLKEELKHYKTELLKEQSKNDELTKKVIQERKRVIGWKRIAERSGNESKKKSVLFDVEPKALPNVDVYAPMTEQHSDEKENTTDDDILLVSVGETEYEPVEIRSADSDADDCPDSPSIFTEKRPAMISLKTPSTGNNQQQVSRDKVFETSDDLFGDPSSPFHPRTSFCSTFKPESRPPVALSIERKDPSETVKSKKKIATASNSVMPLVSDKFTSSTPKPVPGHPPIAIDLVHKEGKTIKETAKPKDQGYKCVEVIRNKAEREKLKGFTCHECDKFYANEKLTEEERKDIIDRCSRHRYKEAPPPSTPDDFWAVSFPSTQDYIARGLMEVDKTQTQKDNKLSRERTRKRIKYQ